MLTQNNINWSEELTKRIKRIDEPPTRPVEQEVKEPLYDLYKTVEERRLVATGLRIIEAEMLKKIAERRMKKWFPETVYSFEVVSRGLC